MTGPDCPPVGATPDENWHHDTWHSPGCDCSWCLPPPVGATDSPDERPTDGSARAVCDECGETIYQHAGEPWLHVETGLSGCCYATPEPPPAPPPPREYEKCKECGEDLVLRHYCGDLLGAVATVRALHFATASSSGGANCGGCSHFWPCPTIAALDRAGCR